MNHETIRSNRSPIIGLKLRTLQMKKLPTRNPIKFSARFIQDDKLNDSAFFRCLNDVADRWAIFVTKSCASAHFVYLICRSGILLTYNCIILMHIFCSFAFANNESGGGREGGRNLNKFIYDHFELFQLWAEKRNSWRKFSPFNKRA